MAIQHTPYDILSQNQLTSIPSSLGIYPTGGEAANRDLFAKVASAFQSNNPKENFKALTVLQNAKIINQRGPGSKTESSATDPTQEIGLKFNTGKDSLELKLTEMIEAGEISPSPSMKEMADRHGITIPKEKPREELEAGMVPSTLQKREVEPPKSPKKVQSPELRELNSKLLQGHNKEMTITQKIHEGLDVIFEEGLNTRAKDLLKDIKEGKADPSEPTDLFDPMPWAKKKPGKEKSQTALSPETPGKDGKTAYQKIGLLNTQNPIQQRDTLTNWFSKKMDLSKTALNSAGKTNIGAAGTFGAVLSQSKEQIGKVLDSAKKEMSTKSGDAKESESGEKTLKNAGKAGIQLAGTAAKTAASAFLTPAGGIAVGIVVDAATTAFNKVTDMVLPEGPEIDRKAFQGIDKNESVPEQPQDKSETAKEISEEKPGEDLLGDAAKKNKKQEPQKQASQDEDPEEEKGKHPSKGIRVSKGANLLPKKKPQEVGISLGR